MLYVVGKTTAVYNKGVVWEVMGIYDSEELALSNSKPGYWIGPIEINKPISYETMIWPGSYFIKKED